MIKIQDMKRYILSIIALALSMLGVNAQTVSVSDVTLNPGETKAVSIYLTNAQTNIVSFQMDLVLPEGVTVDKAGCVLGSRITDTNQELIIGKQPDGSIRFTSTSLALNPITGTSGEIIKVSLTAANDAKGGTATLKKIIFATSDSQTLISEELSFKVNVPYTLTYKVDGEVYKTSTVPCGAAITPEESPIKEGHTFSGWSGIPSTMPNHDVEVTGTFTVNTYTLTYMVNGEVYKTSSVAYGTAITPEDALTKEGYTFSGWSEIPGTMPAKDVVITGSFSINSYTLTYLIDGEVYKTSTVVYGTPLTIEEEPAKEGYTFSGWSELPETMPAHDVTVEGKYTINTHTLTYMVNGIVYKTYQMNYHQAITPEPAPESEGFTFSGWSEIPELMPDNDVVVTGTLTINSYTLTYMVDGEVYKTYSVTYGAALTLEAEPEKEGYTFSGWSEIPETMPAKDVTVTGTFTINSYTLTYMVDGEVYKTYSVTYGTTLTLEAEPTKEGYTFSGWSEIPETMPAKDVTVTGTFAANFYTLTYMVDGEVYKTSSVPYGSRITPEAEPEKEGYSFSGWSEIPESMPAKDVIVTGNFIIKLATGIVLDKDVLTINAFKPQKLNVVLAPADLLNKTVIWDSANPNIVKVNTDGEVKPVNNGEAYIIVCTTDGSELKDSCKVTVDIPNPFETTVTQTTLALQTKNGVPEAKNLKVNIGDNMYDLGVEGTKITGLAPNKTYSLKVKAEFDGIEWIEVFDVTTADIAVEFDCKATPTTIDVSATYDAGDATVTHAGFDRGMEQHSISLTGLEPAQQYEYIYYITTEEGGTATYKAQVTTEAVEMKIKETKVVAVGEVVSVASSNIVEEDVSVGFEWRRFDWPDEIENRSGAAYIYESTIEGSIKNLNADKFWKIRPYFLSKMGKRFYGEWVTVDPSDASYFEPSVHTYNSINVEDNKAELKGFVMEGTDNVEKQGFMYWKNVPSSTRRYAKGIPDNAMVIEVKGNKMVAMLENLDFDTEYCYVAFVTTSDKETFYGEEHTFKTGEPSQDVIDGISDIKHETLNIELSGTWYDLNGRRLSAPQKGINIIRMSDGTIRKVMIK